MRAEIGARGASAHGLKGCGAGGRGPGRLSLGGPGSGPRPHFVLDASLKQVPGTRRRSRGFLTLRSGLPRGSPPRGHAHHPPPVPLAQPPRVAKRLLRCRGEGLADAAGGAGLPASIRSLLRAWDPLRGSVGVGQAGRGRGGWITASLEMWGRDSCGRGQVWRLVKDRGMERSLLEDSSGNGNGARRALGQVCWGGVVCGSC